MYLVVIVPPEDVNGNLALLPELIEDMEKVFAQYSLTVHIEVVADGDPGRAA